VTYRLLALVAGLAPALAALAPVSPSARMWVVVGLGMGLGIVVQAILRQRFGAVLLGSVLATSAGLLSLEAHRRVAETAALEAAPIVDLTTGAMPRPAPAAVTVRGYFRNGWQLDEYAVEDGARPDQSQAAKAVLVPFVGTTDDVIALDGPVVLARVEPARAKMTGLQTIEGTTTPADAELLGVLVQVAGVDDPAHVEGVIVDTLSRPPRKRPWVQLFLATLGAIAAVVVYSVAMHRPS
jgi:hypothetical protein